MTVASRAFGETNDVFRADYGLSFSPEQGAAAPRRPASIRWFADYHREITVEAVEYADSIESSVDIESYSDELSEPLGPPPDYPDSVAESDGNCITSTQNKTSPAISTLSPNRQTRHQSIASISGGIPYSLPSRIRSLQEHMNNEAQARPYSNHMPDNAYIIHTSQIISPPVTEVDPRFKIPLEKLNSNEVKVSSSFGSHLTNMLRRYSSHKNEDNATTTHCNLIDSQSKSSSGFFRKKLTELRRGSNDSKPSAIINEEDCSDWGTSDKSVKIHSFGKINSKPSEFHLHERYEDMGMSLGKGSSGKVSLMKNIQSGELYAVKHFMTEGKDKKEQFKRIHSEYTLGTIFSHPNIIGVVEIIHDSNEIYQVMEFAQYDLFAVVMSDDFSYDEACCIFRQVITGVKYMHDLGTSHRDLKLDNVVVNCDGIAKIIDFGAATVYQYPCSKSLVSSTDVAGSDPYLAPEVVLYDSYDPRPADIWALGIMLVCMLLKKFPWMAPRLTDHTFLLFCFCNDQSSFQELMHDVPFPPKYDATKGKYLSEDERSTISSRWQNLQILSPEMNFVLKRLPEETHSLVMQMLCLAPSRRICIDELAENPWVRSIDMCSQACQDGHTKIYKSNTHSHTEPPPGRSRIADWESDSNGDKDADDRSTAPPAATLSSS